MSLFKRKTMERGQIPVKAPALDPKVLWGVLLVCSYFRYYQIDEFAHLMNLSVYGANYVLDGMFDVVQSAILGVLFWGLGKIWGVLATPVCITGVSEGLQVSVCRLSVTDITQVPHGMNLCNYVTGMPVGSLMAALTIIGTMLTYGYVYAKQQRHHYPDTE